MDRIYFDNAATTPVSDEVVQAMLPYFTHVFGNASSVHRFGQEAHAAMDSAREKVAKALGAKGQEIYFTSGGTEADNWAIRGALAASKRGNHVITSAVEHHAVLHTLESLQKSGEADVTFLPVDEYGRVTAEQVAAAIRPDTALVTVMAANNEVGTLMPVGEIGAVCRKEGVWFHTDAVQAVGHVPIDVAAMNIDMLTLSGHKLRGPKGIGALYIRTGVRIANLMEGGAHERGRRPGTENVPGIVGLGVAVERAAADMDKNAAHLTAMRDRMMMGIIEKIPEIKINGHPMERLPGNVNVSIIYIEGEGLLLSLDLKGIAASSGSACTSGSLDPSHVLLAMGLDHATAHGSLRLSLGEQNTMEEVERFLEELPPIVDRLRAMSPLFAQKEGGLSYV